jgi:DNA-3-methyladenine glycosylase I
MSLTYCQAAPGHEFHGPYHDTEYGFPARADAVLFERLVLEINQAGLSWLTVLKKRPAFVAAYDGFDIDRVAGYGTADIERLLADAGIIRNRLKIAAAIDNARRLQAIRQSHGSFSAWLDSHHPLDRPAWVKLFGATFRFTGGEIVGEFLMSLGYLPGAHVETCPIYARILELQPPWHASAEISSGASFIKKPHTIVGAA